MRLVLALTLAGMGAIALAQDKPALALTAEDKLLIQAVMALQKQASAECDALPSVKQYADLVNKATAQFKVAGKVIDWRTGTLAQPEPPK